MSKKLDEHCFYFGKNIGDSLRLQTDFMDNDDGVKRGLYYKQKLILQGSYNSAQFNLDDITITPENLRQLADQLENKILTLKNNL